MDHTFAAPSPPASSPPPQPGSKRPAAASTLWACPVDWDFMAPRRSCPVDDVMRRAPVIARAPVCTYYDNLLCETCGSGDLDGDLLLCDGCDRGHHTFCLRPVVDQVPVGPWFCPVCAPPADQLTSSAVNQKDDNNEQEDEVMKDEQHAAAAESRPSIGDAFQEDEQNSKQDTQPAGTRLSQG